MSSAELTKGLEKTQGFFCLPAICGVFSWVVEFALGFRAYPNNPLYCGRLQSPMPALSAKNVLNVEKTTPPSIFGLPPWPSRYIGTRPHNDPVIRISS
jgi:hypothetical protein